MRCGTRIVSKGDIQAKVLRFCGEPETVSTRYSERAGYVPRHRYDDRYLIRYRDYGRYFRTEVIIEEWVYNLGPNKLMRRITFENGVVRKVETLGRGYR